MNFYNVFRYRISILLLLVLSSCEYEYIEQKYEGYFYETKWIYDFNIDGTYKSSSFGHLGVEGVFDSGRYSIINSTIQLYPRIDDSELRDYRKFFVVSNQEIIDMNGNSFYDKIPDYGNFNYKYEDCFQENLKEVIDMSEGYDYLESQLYSEYDHGFDTIYYGMHMIEKHNDDVFKVYGYKYYDSRIKMEIVADRTKRYVSINDRKVYLMGEDGLKIEAMFVDSCK